MQPRLCIECGTRYKPTFEDETCMCGGELIPVTDHNRPKPDLLATPELTNAEIAIFHLMKTNKGIRE